VVKVRERDFKEEVQLVEPATKADLVRLAKMVREIPAPDLTAIERRLIASEATLNDLRAVVAQTPEAATYEFEIIRDGDGRITSVIARPQQAQ
jgi:hypothetical protein